MEEGSAGCVGRARFPRRRFVRLRASPFLVGCACFGFVRESVAESATVSSAALDAASVFCWFSAVPRALASCTAVAGGVCFGMVSALGASASLGVSVLLGVAAWLVGMGWPGGVAGVGCAARFGAVDFVWAGAGASAGAGAGPERTIKKPNPKLAAIAKAAVATAIGTHAGRLVGDD